MLCRAKPHHFWRLLPDQLKASLYHRFFYPPVPRYHALYESAPLRYAPDVEMHLEPQDRMHGQIAFLGWYEQAFSKEVATRARDSGGLFVDVGANVGYYALLWVAQSPDTNRAIALEPSPRVLPLLKENVERNSFRDQITVLHTAAGRAHGAISFDLGPDKETGWGGFAPEANERTVRVEERRLDGLIDEPIQFLKIDAEGADAWVLQGAERLLAAKQIACIHFEHNLDRAQALGIAPEEPVRFLESHGYEVIPDGDEWWARPAS
jgi:FkbM family methyltransferase